MGKIGLKEAKANIVSYSKRISKDRQSNKIAHVLQEKNYFQSSANMKTSESSGPLVASRFNLKKSSNSQHSRNMTNYNSMSNF